MKVYKAICAVIDDLSKTGVSKDRKNQQQGYRFRSIDDFYYAVSPLLPKHGLCILPRVISRECVERTTKNGGSLFYTTVEVEYDMVSAEDGSKHTVLTIGEAMDSADKSTNKAMSAAYKYALIQAFCVPVEGNDDADAETPPETEKKGYTDTDIEKYLPGWKKAGISGQDCVKRICSKYTLTDKQAQRIMDELK